MAQQRSLCVEEGPLSAPPGKAREEERTAIRPRFQTGLQGEFTSRHRARLEQRQYRYLDDPGASTLCHAPLLGGPALGTEAAAL